MCVCVCVCVCWGLSVICLHIYLSCPVSLPVCPFLKVCLPVCQIVCLSCENFRSLSAVCHGSLMMTVRERRRESEEFRNSTWKKCISIKPMAAGNTLCILSAHSHDYSHYSLSLCFMSDQATTKNRE